MPTKPEPLEAIIPQLGNIVKLFFIGGRALFAAELRTVGKFAIAWEFQAVFKGLSKDF